MSMKSALLGTSALDQHLHIEVPPPKVFLSHNELASVDSWDAMRSLIASKGVPEDSIGNGTDFKQEVTSDGIWLEFP